MLLWLNQGWAWSGLGSRVDALASGRWLQLHHVPCTGAFPTAAARLHAKYMHIKSCATF